MYQLSRITFTWTTERTTWEQLHQFGKYCQTNQGFAPAGLKLKSPLNTQEAIQIVKSTCRRPVKTRIKNCDRRLNYCNNKLQQLDKLKQLLPTNLLDTVTTIAERRADKTSVRVRTEQERKRTRLITQQKQKPTEN